MSFWTNGRDNSKCLNFSLEMQNNPYTFLNLRHLYFYSFKIKQVKLILNPAVRNLICAHLSNKYRVENDKEQNWYEEPDSNTEPSNIKFVVKTVFISSEVSDDSFCHIVLIFRIRISIRLSQKGFHS